MIKQTDVIVCGAGPAGIGAALAAARSGVRVQMIDVHGCLGGVWTAGLLTWIIDTQDKPGILVDLMQRLEERGAALTENNTRKILHPKPQYAFGYDVEKMKVLLEDMCLEDGIDIRYHTRVVGAYCGENRELTTIITESKSGREAWQSSMFVDCTGEGDLAALAGCGFDYGDPETGKAQPMSLLGIIGGVEAEKLAPFHRYSGKVNREAKHNLLEEIRRAGINPSYEGPTLFKITDNLFTLMANHQYGVSGMNADEVTHATISARRELHTIVHALRSLGGVWENLHLVSTASQIGVREGRRIHGLYTVSTDDIINGARHPDAVCRSHMSADVHSINPQKDKVTTQNRPKVQPYDIPLRALIAKDVNRLLLAGRCISGSFYAHSSYRVTGNAVALGQGAGVAAALSVQHKTLPQELPGELLKAAQEKLSVS